MEKTISAWQSDSQEISRSQINLAPYNPRKINPKARALLKKNIKARGMMGGIVWNKATANCVAGHQRIGILDELENYDGTPATDYKLRVDVVELTEKEEKEQNIIMNNRAAQGEFDTDLLKELIGEIDYKDAGLDDTDLKFMGIEINPAAAAAMMDVNTDLADLQKPAAEKKEAVKSMKADIKAKAAEKVMQHDAFVMLSFDSYDQKCEFMARFGYDVDEKYIAGGDFNEMIERVDI